MNEEDIAATGEFAGLSSVDPVPAYKPPEVPTRPSVGGIAASQQKTDANPSPSLTAGGANQSARPPSAEQITAAIGAANANLASSDRSLEYRVDAATGISIAMIRNSQTGAIVQQIPGADIIALARMLAEWAPGKHMLLDLIA